MVPTPDAYALLARALAQTGQGRYADAAATNRTLAPHGGVGASH
jgi:hypothetical protein